MLVEVITGLTTALGEYASTKFGTPIPATTSALRDHTGNPVDVAGGSDNVYVVTLVETTQKKDLRTPPTSTNLGATQGKVPHPPLNLEIGLLISSISNNYHTALRMQESALEFFQIHQKATNQMIPTLPQGVSLNIVLGSMGAEATNELISLVSGSNFLTCLHYRIWPIPVESTPEALITTAQNIQTINVN